MTLHAPFHPLSDRRIGRRDVFGLMGGMAFGFAAPRTAFAKPAGVTGRLQRLMDLGARGDGITDDGPALAAALKSGAMIDGGGRTYGIGGDMTITGRCGGLANATLRQLQPRTTRRITLSIIDAADFTLENVTVVRGGDGSEVQDKSLILSNNGIFIQRCERFALRGLTVTGGGIGNGIEINHAANFTADDIHIHDIFWKLPAKQPTDDAIEGILFAGSQDFTASNIVVADIGGTAGGVLTHDQSRGVAVGGCNRFTLKDVDIRRVGQGLDVTGGSGNGNFTILGGVVQDCVTWGFKFANSAHDGKIVGATAIRCGIGGFVASPPSDPSDMSVTTQRLRFDRCRAQAVLGNYPRSPGFGFGILGNALTGFRVPNGIVFDTCVADGRAPGSDMRFGFRNDIPDQNAQGSPNRVTNCRAMGYTQAAFQGFST